jgi:2-hydroxychromene-2-carboxylate isomerase
MAVVPLHDRPEHLAFQAADSIPKTTFFVGDRMFWGNDRLVLLEHYLAQQGRR